MPDADTQIVLDRVEVFDCSKCAAALDVSDLAAFTEVECPQCGNRDTVPAKLGPFTILNLINTGGMGAVYRARDESLGRLVAIKVMLKKLGEDPKVVDDFRREAQAAARLNHPNVAQIYSFGQEHRQPYIVMELVSGKRFDKMIEERKSLDPTIVMKVGEDIAEGLKAAEDIGLVHGDVKPENILLDEKNNAKLVDFGIASFVDQASPEKGIWGTPYYIAPEKVTRKKSDTRSDIYSLGATLYHALAGKPPFDGATPLDVVRARLTATPKPLSSVNSRIPKSMSELIARMLEREPSLRHPTYASLISDLRREFEECSKSSTGSFKTGMSGKKIRIKKNAKGSPSASAPATPGTADREAVPSVKTTRRDSGVRTVNIASRKNPGRVVATTIMQKTPEQTRLERKKRAKARAVQATVFAIILIIAGGAAVGLLLNSNHKKNIAEAGRRNRLSIARGDCGSLASKIREHGEAVKITAGRIQPFLAEVESAVLFVEDAPLKSFYKKNRPKSMADVPPKSAGSNPNIPSDGAEASDAEREAPGPILDEGGREAPFSGESREVVERQRLARNKGREVGAPEPAGGDVVGQADSLKASTPDPSASTNGEDTVDAFIERMNTIREPIKGPEIVVLADHVVIFSERIEKRLFESNQHVEEAFIMRDTAEETHDPSVAESLVTNMMSHLEFVQNSKTQISDWIEAAKLVVAKVDQMRVATKSRRENEARLEEERQKAEAY
ncbi:MAG: serine/threonine-protein kinase, partial [Verrucomicrobia bacterium]|nr:serine/threonine-protein kinase [Verrucomicrobiota bacterium]